MALLVHSSAFPYLKWKKNAVECKFLGFIPLVLHDGIRQLYALDWLMGY